MLCRTFTLAARRPWWVIALLPVVGCGSDASLDAATAGPSQSEGGALPSGSDVSVEFVEPELNLAPEQVVEVGVRVVPAKSVALRISLVGDSRDAYLDRADVQTDDSGAGLVLLTAPSTPAIFSLRASTVDGAHAELRVATGEAFTSLVVLPRYDVQSPRPVTEWTATVSTGLGCTGSEIPPPDGAQVATAPANGQPRIESVPVGVPLTVTARSGHFAGGCRELTGAVAGEINTLEIDVRNRPLQMPAAAFRLRLGIDEGAWRAALGGVVEALVQTTITGAPTDLARVLAVMDTVVEADSADMAAAFRAQRASADWESLATAALGDRAVGGMRDGLRARVLAGLDALVADQAIDAVLTASGLADQSATLEFLSVGGATATVAGFPDSVVGSWTPGAEEDWVNLGGEITWSPGKLVAAVSDVTTGSQGGTARDAAEAFGCQTLGEALAAGGVDGLAYASCDATCAAQFCRQAVRDIWESAQAAFEASATLTLAVAGHALVDDEAVPTGLSGTWVGAGEVVQTEIRFEGPSLGGDGPTP